ncbi:metal ABC transporter solute-binding protein, Zn/Mn family [Filibacter tadaridae]|nr:zinc ABC transporter substrate-binding protein [Filibacter tadaridae]
MKVTIIAAIAVLLLAACGNGDKGETGKSDSGKIKVVATFSILYDIATQVGGDLVEVHSMVPIGTAPHEYDPLPEDIKKATDADILFYNGLNLEGGENGWFFKLINTVNADKEKVFELMEGVEPKYITTDDGTSEKVNPHAFLDPVIGIKMTENARDAFIKIDPDNKETYEKNAESLLNELYEVDEEYKTKIDEIPKEKRILITSERAYQYMAQRYGLKEGFIWDIDTEEQGTPSQITSLVKFINSNNVPVLFVESNVDPRPMETVSRETGVKIDAELFSDELGKPGEEGDTLVKFLRYNIERIHEGLMK